MFTFVALAYYLYPIDIRIDKKWNFKKVALDLFLEVQNVLGNNSPQPPEYGLLLDDTGTPVDPRQLFPQNP